jgi:hypothetical protein
MDSRAAGWKRGMHDAPYYKQAHWFRLGYGELFMELSGRYLAQVSRIDRHHPFGLINLRRAPIGEMYCLAQYLKAHASACKRIELTVVEFLDDQGWREGSHGEILNKVGTTVFDAGFVSAIRKVLGDSN